MLLYGKAHHVTKTAISWKSTNPRLRTGCAGLSLLYLPTGLFLSPLSTGGAGGLDTELQYAMDLDLWIRFGKLQQKNPQWKFKHVPQVLASSRMHSSNKTFPDAGSLSKRS
jgi:hypothetical protein